MKKTILSLSLILVGLATQAQDKTTAPITTPIVPTAVPAPVVKGGGVINFSTETYDFGEVIEGVKVTHDYVFTNTGIEPIILSNVKASCGCTTPTWSKEPILPGKTGTISATFNSQGRAGVINKSITVTSNASEPTKVIFLKGTVKKAPVEAPAPEKAPSLMSEPKN
jgi:hypothetical protein